jgi:hypothetical protein
MIPIPTPLFNLETFVNIFLVILEVIQDVMDMDLNISEDVFCFDSVFSSVLISYLFFQGGMGYC